MAKINKHCMILFNSTAGYLKVSPEVNQFQTLVDQVGLDATVVPTKTKDEMVKLIRRYKAASVQKIAVAGGDGTVATAVQQLAYTDIPLGIIPLGTYNNFATALRIPADMVSALRAIKGNETRLVSLGKANDIYFTESAGVGLFADALALYGADQNKNLLYGAWAVLRLAYLLPSHHIKLTIDGQPYDDRAVMCTVANSFRMGAAIPIAPEARLTDNVLDVVVIGDVTYKELLPYYRAIRSQIHPVLPKVKTFRAKEIKIEASRQAVVHADDGVIGHTPVTISIAPKALRVIVDRL